MSLFFEEIDGQKRKVFLQDSEAPFGGRRIKSAFTLGGEVRKHATWETGVRTPVVHITGTTELPIEIEFHLRDSETGKPGNADKRLDLIDGIRLAARPIRVVWNGRFRRGIIEKFEAGVEDAGEYACKLHIDVWDQGDEPSEIRKNTLSLPISIQGVSDSLTKTTGKLLSFPGMPFDLANTLSALISPAINFTAALLSLVEDFEAEAVDIQQLGDRVANQCLALIFRVINIISFVECIVEDLIDDEEDAFDWRIVQAEALDALDRILTQSYAVGEAVETRMQEASNGGAPERVYITRQGDTLESVARMFSTTFEALVALNPSVPMGRLPDGTVLQIP